MISTVSLFLVEDDADDFDVDVEVDVEVDVDVDADNVFCRSISGSVSCSPFCLHREENIHCISTGNKATPAPSSMGHVSLKMHGLNLHATLLWRACFATHCEHNGCPHGNRRGRLLSEK